MGVNEERNKLSDVCMVIVLCYTCIKYDIKAKFGQIDISLPSSLLIE